MLQTYEPHDAGELWEINQMVYKIRETISRRMSQGAAENNWISEKILEREAASLYAVCV